MGSTYQVRSILSEGRIDIRWDLVGNAGCMQQEACMTRVFVCAIAANVVKKRKSRVAIGHSRYGG